MAGTTPPWVYDLQLLDKPPSYTPQELMNMLRSAPPMKGGKHKADPQAVKRKIDKLKNADKGDKNEPKNETPANNADKSSDKNGVL